MSNQNPPLLHPGPLDGFSCAIVKNIHVKDTCLELLNGISYNYELAERFDRVVVGLFSARYGL